MAPCGSAREWIARQETQRGLWSVYAESVDALAETHAGTFLPDLQRRSALLTLYAALEAELDGLCQTLQESRHLGLGAGDLRSRGLERSALYLEKVAGLPTAREGPAWLELTRIRELRNLLIHADGRLPEHKPDLERYLATSPCFRAEREEGRAQLRLEPGCLHHVLKVWGAYVRDLDHGLVAG
ncbi:MAG TPA: hypothetical protein VJ570_03380 [Holophagaceae bacterium]|nr:hypothetical protein [Holophagaceae bacterium]